MIVVRLTIILTLASLLSFVPSGLATGEWDLFGPSLEVDCAPGVDVHVHRNPLPPVDAQLAFYCHGQSGARNADCLFPQADSSGECYFSDASVNKHYICDAAWPGSGHTTVQGTGCGIVDTTLRVDECSAADSGDSCYFIETGPNGSTCAGVSYYQASNEYSNPMGLCINAMFSPLDVLGACVTVPGDYYRTGGVASASGYCVIFDWSIGEKMICLVGAQFQEPPMVSEPEKYYYEIACIGDPR